MAAYQFFIQACHHVREVECTFLLRHTGVENDLQQQVAELLTQISEVSARNCVCDLVGLFDRVWGDAGKILLKIPGTAGAGRPQRRHDRKQPVDLRHSAPVRRSRNRRATTGLRTELPKRDSHKGYYGTFISTCDMTAFQGLAVVCCVWASNCAGSASSTARPSYAGCTCGGSFPRSSSK